MRVCVLCVGIKEKKNITQALLAAPQNTPNANIAGCASDISLGKFGFRCICGEEVCNIDNFACLLLAKGRREKKNPTPRPSGWWVKEREKEARRSDERHNIYGWESISRSAQSVAEKVQEKEAGQ